jgi:uncharacterized protein YbcI
MADAPDVSVETDAPGRSVAAAISNAVVGLMHGYTGRGPTRARTTIGPDMITVTLRDSLTKAERTLADNGYAVEVLAQRRLMQHTMRDDMITAVETLTGRTVEAFLTDNLHVPDIAVEVFLLERGDHNGTSSNGQRASSDGHQTAVTQAEHERPARAQVARADVAGARTRMVSP